jgi:hypothetical protein
MTKLDEIRRLLYECREDLGVGFTISPEDIIGDIELILNTRCATHGLVLPDSNECLLCLIGTYDW